MSEHASEGQSEQQSISRRELLRRTGKAVGVTLGTGVLLGGASSAVYYGGKATYDGGKEWLGHSNTEGIFGDIMNDSHKFMIYDGLLQIDREASVADSIFGHASKREDLAGNGFIVAQRPIAVHGTLLRNIADYDQSTQNRVDFVLPDVHSRLMAFYHPNGSGKLLYLDADANSGLVTPLSPSAVDTVSFEHLPVSNVDIQGRELRGKEIYPYTKELYKDFRSGKIVENYHFIGQSATASNSDELNAIANNFFYGTDSVSFPSA